MSFIFLLFFCFFQIYAYERPLVVVIPSYNNAQWYKQNLDSVFCQQYENYRVIYIDDCSSDNTFELVQHYIYESGQKNRVTLIRDEQRKGALANHYYAVHECENHEIILNLDGDDYFKHPQVFERINEVYQNANV